MTRSSFHPDATCKQSCTPDLCIAGIQQYLFENSRIDNIFTDIYYERFTDCLNEVLQKYEVRLNTAGESSFAAP